MRVQRTIPLSHKQLLNAFTGEPPAPGDAGARFFHDDLLEMSTPDLQAERGRIRLRFLIDQSGADPWAWWWEIRVSRIEQELARRKEAARHGRR